jgi:hypothetical protein
MYASSYLHWQYLQETPSPQGSQHSDEAIIHVISYADDSVCKNSAQGMSWITDSKGFLCNRNDVDQITGCCIRSKKKTVEEIRVNEKVTIEKSDRSKYESDYGISALRQFDCSHCIPKYGCCEDYEHCISCCLKPENIRKHLKSYMNMPAIQRIVKSNSDSLKHLDNFEYCRSACRTSSSSVQSENTYRGSHNHCYGLKQAPLERIPVSSDWTGYLRLKE